MDESSDASIKASTSQVAAAVVAETPARAAERPEAVPDVDVEVEETDSALGEDVPTDTTSLASTIHRHRHELGRTFHKYRGGENDYYAPNDEQQNNQLDIGHHMLTLLLNNRLYLAPLEQENVHRVLDLGCGTGIWAIDFADAFPEAEVTGVDLSPIQPTFIPPNLQFVVDDVTDQWQDPPDYFDFVHIRCLYGSVTDWPALFRQAYYHIVPGGWVQSLEIDIQFMSDDGSIPRDHILHRWSDVFIAAGEKLNKTMKIAERAKGWIEDAGFEDVQSVWYKVPVGKWPKDKALKVIGIWNYHYCYEGCEGWALFLLMKILGWSMVETQLFIAEFRKALQDPKVHAYYRVGVAYGRKPVAKEKTA